MQSILDGGGKRNSLLAMAALIAGLGQYVHFNLGVRISLSELLLPFLMLMTRGEARGDELTRKECLTVIVTAVAWIVGILFSDMYHSVAVFETVKAIARPVIMIGFFLFYFRLLNQDLRVLLLFFVGSFLGTCIHMFFGSAEDTLERGLINEYNFAVFRVSPAVFMGVSLLAYYFCERLKIVSIVGILAAIAYLGLYSSRSTAAVVLLHFMLLSYFIFHRARHINLILSPTRFIPFIVVLGIALTVTITYSYIYLAKNGVLGSFAEKKLKDQTRARMGSEAFDLLIGGRTDAIA